MKITLAQMFAKELETEAASTRKCLERIPESLFDWAPHEKSMKMGYLALLVADVPKWLTATVDLGEINFATWEKYTEMNFKDLVNIFDKNIKEAKKTLENVSDEALAEMFYLKAGPTELMKLPKGDSIRQSINHWVHHRGQLTVYMRLKQYSSAIYLRPFCRRQ